MKQLDEQTNVELNRRYKMTATILLTQIFVVAILAAAAWFFAGKFMPFGTPATDASFELEKLTNPSAGGSTLTTFLWITILAIAIAAFLLRRVIFAPAVLRDTATIGGAVGLLRSLERKTILLASLGEIVAFLGFVIALASGSPFDMFRALLVSFVVFFVSFPRKSAWQRLAAAASR